MAIKIEQVGNDLIRETDGIVTTLKCAKCGQKLPLFTWECPHCSQKLVAEKLEVDAFEIDIETLDDADGCRTQWTTEKARIRLINLIIENLTQESKKIFEEYQEQNNPCRG